MSDYMNDYMGQIQTQKPVPDWDISDWGTARQAVQKGDRASPYWVQAKQFLDTDLKQNLSPTMVDFWIDKTYQAMLNPATGRMPKRTFPVPKGENYFSYHVKRLAGK